MAKVEIGNMLGMHTAQEAYKEIVQNLWKNAPWRRVVTRGELFKTKGLIRENQKM